MSRSMPPPPPSTKYSSHDEWLRSRFAKCLQHTCTTHQEQEKVHGGATTEILEKEQHDGRIKTAEDIYAAYFKLRRPGREPAFTRYLVDKTRDIMKNPDVLSEGFKYEQSLVEDFAEKFGDEYREHTEYIGRDYLLYKYKDDFDPIVASVGKLYATSYATWRALFEAEGLLMNNIVDIFGNMNSEEDVHNWYKTKRPQDDPNFPENQTEPLSSR